MGPFNRGEVEYIKAISGGHSHHTYKGTITDFLPNGGANANDHLPNDNTGRYTVFTLLDPLVYDPTNHPNHATNKQPIAFSSQFTNGHQNIPVYTIPQATNPENPTVTQRRGEQFFLDTVTGKLRIVQAMTASDDSSEHTEYRLLVFRHKERQHFDQERSLNFCNPEYDLFVNPASYKVGPRGYRRIDIVHGDEEYVSQNSSDQKVQFLMTAMLNKEDYVFMKDTRFYLGKEYGGKHIYETQLSWDHRDQLESDHDIIIDSETATKNYCWYIYLIRTNNNNGTVFNSDPVINYSFTTTGTS